MTLFDTSKSFRKTIMLIAVMVFFVGNTMAQRQVAGVGIKTNALYGAVALAPNLGVEVGLGDKFSLDMGAGYNGWNRDGHNNDNRKLVHWLAQAEGRYWFCESFGGWFVGAHLLGGQFNISGRELPLLLGSGSGDSRYEGYGYGGGVSGGYQFLLARRWGLELSLGAGYARLHYDRYECRTCGVVQDHNQKRNYWGPTKATVSILFLL